jgi:hypothetical protein
VDGLDHRERRAPSSEMQDGVVAVERGVGAFDNTWTLIAF